MSMSNNRNTAPPDGKILKALFRIAAVVVFLDAVVNIIICLSGDDTDTVTGGTVPLFVCLMSGISQ